MSVNLPPPLPAVGKVDPFGPFVSRFGVAILDGGLTTALPGGAEKHVLWGHQLLYDTEDWGCGEEFLREKGRSPPRRGLRVLRDVHTTWMENGADVIGTLSYKLSDEIIRDARGRGLLDGMDEEVGADELIGRSVAAATEARDEFAARQAGGSDLPAPLVFASVGPTKDSTQAFVGAADPNTRSSGLEDAERMRSYYFEKVGSILRAGENSAGRGVDGIAVETLAGSREAGIAAEVLSGYMGVPMGPSAFGRDYSPSLDPGRASITFCCGSGSETTSGEPLRGAVRDLLVRYPHVVSAVGVNCVDPAHAVECVRNCVAGRADALDDAGERDDPPRRELISSVHIAVYPNSGEVWDAREGSRSWSDTRREGSGGGMKYLVGEDALAYKAAGASVIGGCCRVQADQIRLFRDALAGD